MSGKKITIPYQPQDYQKQIHQNPKRFKVVIIGRRGGKTELAENEIIKKAITKPGLYWIIAPTYKQVKSINWERLKILLKNDTNWKFNEQELSAEHPLIKTKIELKGADNEDSLRGVGLDGVVLDEAAMIKPNVWPEVIRPMLSDRMGWALFITTPKGRNWLYDLFGRDKEDPSWHSWRYPTSINTYISPEEIEQAKKDMPEKLFRQEYMAEFLDEDTGVFKKITQCIVGELKEPELGRFYIMGVDLAKNVDFTVLTILDSVTRETVYFERFNDISWKEQKTRIQRAAIKYNNALCVIDSTGVGEPIFEDLQQSGVSCEPFKFTSTSKNQLIDQLAIAIEQRLVTFPRIDVLIDELRSYEYSISDSKRIIYSAPEGKHDDCVISLALACWGIRNYLNAAQVFQERIYADPVDRQGQGELITEPEPHYSGY